MPPSDKTRLLKLIAAHLDCELVTVAFLDVLTIKQLEVVAELIEKQCGRRRKGNGK